MGAGQREYLSAADMSGGTVTGIPVGTRGCVKASFQSTWTGTPTGVIKLQGSNHRLAVDNPSDVRVAWTDLTVAASGIHGAANPAGAASATGQIQIVTFLPRFIRLVYTGAGAGALTVQLDLDDVAD